MSKPRVILVPDRPPPAESGLWTRRLLALGGRAAAALSRPAPATPAPAEAAPASAEDCSVCAAEVARAAAARQVREARRGGGVG